MGFLPLVETFRSPVVGFVTLGLLLYVLFAKGRLPERLPGVLVAFSGLELALSSKPQRYKDSELFLVLLMAAVGVALNPAAAFAAGLPLAYALQRGWLKF